MIFLGILGFTIYQAHAIGVRQAAIEEQVVASKQLADNINRAMATWATKADLEQFAKDSNTNLDAIKKDLATLNSNLTAINVITVHSSGQTASNLTSTDAIKDPNAAPPDAQTITCDGKEVSCPNIDPHGYQGTTQQLALNESFGEIKVPFGSVGFSASQAAPWSLDVKPREYKITTVLGTDENQRIMAYNKMTINTDNKDYEIPIANSEIKQEYPMPKMSWINPRLYLGADFGLTVNTLPIKGEAGPNLAIQLASYGQYKNQPDLSIAQIGIQYDIASKKPDFLLRPISYNIGKHLPLMNNLYIGPAIHVNTESDVSITLGIAAAL